MDFSTGLKRSLKETFGNASLFWVNLLHVVAISIFFLVIIVAGIATSLPLLGTNLKGFLNGNFVPKIPQLLFFSIIAGILLVGLTALLLVNAWFQAGKFALFNNVVEGKRPTKKAFFDSTKSLWKNFFWFGVQKSLFYLALLVPALVATLLALFEVARAPMIVLAVILGVAWLLSSIFLNLAFYFAAPILIRKRLRAWETIKEGTRFLLKEEPLLVILTWLIVFGLSIGLVFSLMIVSLPFTIAGLLGGEIVQAVTSIFFSLIRVTTQVFFAVFITLFLFHMYASATTKNKGVKALLRENGVRKNVAKKKVGTRKQ